jgi:hypothetical protein
MKVGELVNSIENSILAKISAPYVVQFLWCRGAKIKKMHFLAHCLH